MPNKLSQFYLMKRKNYSNSTLLKAYRYGKTGKYLSNILVLAFLNTLGGCYYYKVVTSEDPYPEAIRTQQEEAKFFILHSEEQVWKFSNISLSNETVVGRITPLQGHKYFKTTSTQHANRYKVSNSPEKDEREVINEVHITISEYNTAEGNEISILLENIEKIEIYDKATGSTFASWAFSGIGIVGVLIGLIMYIGVFFIGGA
jgi:hypothetical protein